MRDTVLVGIDYDDKTNTGVLIIGRQRPNKSVDIVNAIDGPEAKELFEKLITKRRKKKKMSNYEKCNGCPYYFGEIDNCMFGEEDVPNNMKKKCEVSDELPV